MNNTQVLQDILEALMTISVKGNDAITMSNCLQTLNKVIQGMRAEAVMEAPAAKPEEE